MAFKNSIDWLEFTIPMGFSQKETMETLDFYLPNKFIKADRAILGYDEMLVGTHECKFLSSQDSRRPEHHVILPGKWCREVGYELLLSLLDWVVNHKGTFSRVDFACDDYNKKNNVQRIFKACKRGQLVSHAQRANVMMEFRGGEGITLNIGSRKSERFLRIYDKNAESKGEFDCTRWEMLMRNENADTAVQMILDAKPDIFERMLVGFADFKECNNKNSARRTRVKWFVDLVHQLKRAEFYKAKIQVTMAKMESWIRKQVGPTIACLLTCKQGDLGIFEDIAEEGRKKWKPVHHIAMALC